MLERICNLNYIDTKILNRALCKQEENAGLSVTVVRSGPAVASYVLPTTGLPRNMALVNLGTFVGALCFFVGVVLLLPERSQLNSD
ncbi:MAG: hypothetical protein WCI87_04900 [Euryarchaeota archaeon]